jgi:hypothetical protein
VANVCSCEPEISGGGWENPMPSVTLFGFPRSVYVQMAGLYLTHKEVPYAFRDLEPDMGTPTHLSLHPCAGLLRRCAPRNDWIVIASEAKQSRSVSTAETDAMKISGIRSSIVALPADEPIAVAAQSADGGFHH